MMTILKPKETIANLWGKQCVKDNVSYRLMKYVLRVEQDNKVLLHNVVTGQLVVLNEDETRALKELPAPYNPTIEALVTNHYLVPQDFDECRSVNQLRKIYQMQSTGEAITHYVILPTTFCNAHCFYCYESDYPRVHMSEETAEKVINYIDKHRFGKEVLLSWFGGEPLVGASRIDQITRGLKNRVIPFTSTMISNGYLFDKELVDRSVKEWNLKRIQITLDGTEKVYNQVKAYVSAKENPYHRVLKNIDLLSSNEVQVNIRLNVDFYNKDDILVLIEELGNRYSGNKYVSVYLNMLFNNAGFKPVVHSQDDRIELLKIIEEYTERLKELKLGSDRLSKIPSLEFSQCMADNPHTIEIQPDGSFCRCEHETIDDSYGNVTEGILDPEKTVIWRENIERSDYCPDCVMYPSCYLLRRCMNADTPCVESIRFLNQKKREEQIRSVYLKSLEDGKNEGF